MTTKPLVQTRLSNLSGMSPVRTFLSRAPTPPLLLLTAKDLAGNPLFGPTKQSTYNPPKSKNPYSAPKQLQKSARFQRKLRSPMSACAAALTEHVQPANQKAKPPAQSGLRKPAPNPRRVAIESPNRVQYRSWSALSSLGRQRFRRNESMLQS